MSDDIIDEINKDLSKLNGKKSFGDRLANTGKELIGAAIFVGSLSLAIQFGIVNPLHDEEPYNDALEQQKKGTLVVPAEFFVSEQAECIKDELLESSNVSADVLDDMSHEEIVDKYAGSVEECQDDKFQTEDMREDYLNDLKNPDFTAGAIGFGQLSAVFIYSGLYGFGAIKRRRAESKIAKRERDRKAFDL
ncbi:MAG: hypothetical protein CL561_05235 [Alphaproteobacteria bacterium]|nr:hypothetical protein [Alphaproteobacteria bacterium]|tara:strand:+ start:1698 stop:2273 length:576 start_codon:yes stop_codon:yes gene_type:complete